MRRRMDVRLTLLLISIIFATTLPLKAKNTSPGEKAKKRRAAEPVAGVLTAADERFGFVIHGGAGTILKSSMTPQMEAEYRAKLQEALLAGYDILKNDGRSLDAVEAALKILEDSPLFNAGRGAVMTSAGTVEMDASIMDGQTLKAGAVAGVKRIKNPISLARLVMEQSPHVMLTGDGAEAFATEKGVKLVAPDYFYTARRRQELQRQKQKEREAEKPAPRKQSRLDAGSSLSQEVEGMGTVGAVALDKHGNLAAATSTGGKTNKRVGRIGDSPVIGAGTYANNNTCAVSATGDGEFFIRAVAAYDISALMEYKNMSVGDAARAVIEKIGRHGGTGGVIVIDKYGNMALPFNTSGMYRGFVGADGKVTVEIYKD